MSTEPFAYRGYTLAEAIDALKAYDNGALDSGISDDTMKAAVRDYLAGLNEDERRSAVAGIIQGMLDDGCELADLVDLKEWLDDLGVRIA